MATFVTTFKFTDQGEKKIQDTTKRAAAFKATAKKMGVKVVAQYWMPGQFDGMLIYEAPDDETATMCIPPPCGHSTLLRSKQS